MSTVTIHEAEAALSRLIEEVLSGKEVIIARRNKPLVRIVPLEPGTGTRTIGSAKGKIVMAPDKARPPRTASSPDFRRKPIPASPA